MTEASAIEISATDYPAPRIIPRSAHPISRKNIDREALKVLYRLRDAGHTAYLVGGGVRDLYMGKTPKDFDISTDARPGALRKLFRNSRLIGRRFRLVQVFFYGGKIVEVSTFRCRSEHEPHNDQAAADAVLAANNTFGSPVEDAFRRDLTINALFYDLQNFSIIDYTGGVEDIDRGIIRLIGDPERRINRDPVRIMRVIRHAARNNFTIESKTWQAILAHSLKLNLCPVSRLRDELMKDLLGGASRPWARLAIDSGVFQILFPFYDKYLGAAAELHDLDGRLLDIFSIIDRLQNQRPLAEHQLLAMLLLPWAETEMNLLKINLKSKEVFQFSRRFRTRIDEIVTHLSIKRSVREAATTLLSNLPVFSRFDQSRNWPKWLKRKSYYRDCRLFYDIYLESLGGPPVDTADLPNAAADRREVSPRPGKRGSSRRRSGARPAFAGKKHGGIFGLDNNRRK